MNHPLPIDWSKCLERAVNDREMARKILSLFIDDLNSARPRIKQAWAEKNYSALFTDVHKLHGGSYYTGIPKMSDILSALDNAIKTPDQAMIATYLQDFEDECDSLINYYNANTFEERSS